MLTAVSSWSPQAAFAATQDSISPASSCESSPTLPYSTWSQEELEAAEALVMLSRSARARQHHDSYHQAAPSYYQADHSYYQAGHSYSQAGISYQLVGPGHPGIQVQPGFYPQPGFRGQRAIPAQGSGLVRDAYAQPRVVQPVAQPVAGPSTLPGSTLKSRTPSPAPEELRTPSPLAKRSRSPTPASIRPLSETSNVGPQRTPRNKGKARASPMATKDQESKGRKRKTKAKPRPQEQVEYDPEDPREYYIARAEWIGLDLETGKPMAGVPPLKSPATEYQAHILTWIFENITPQPDRFWKAAIAIKLSM